MSLDPARPWEQLFPPAPGGVGVVPRAFRLVSKRGEPLLLLPQQRRAASRALALYPAQTRAAQVARRALATALRLGLTTGTRSAQVHVNPQAPFVRFLGLANSTRQEVNFAMLLGNPRVSGRRFGRHNFG